LARRYGPVVRRFEFVLVLGALVACTPGPATPSSPVSAVSSSAPTSTSSTPSPSRSPTAKISVDVPAPADVVAAFGSVWVQGRGDGSLWRIDPAGRVLARIADASFVHHTGR